MATILEALQNADYNISNNGAFGIMIGKDQLHNAVTLLEKGYSIEDDVEDIIGPYERVEDVPEKASI